MQIDHLVLLSGFVGLLLVWLARFPIGQLLKRVKKGIPSPAPSTSVEKKWTDLTTDPKEDKSGAILGDFERILFYLVIWSGTWEVIAGWFALKVASKWEAWGTTGRLPDSLEGIDPLDYAIARRRLASQRLMSFLIGTITNVFVAFGAVVFAKKILLPLIGWCFQ